MGEPARILSETHVSMRRRNNIDAGLTKEQIASLRVVERELAARSIADGEKSVVVDTHGRINPLGDPTIRSYQENLNGVRRHVLNIDPTRVPSSSILVHNHPGFSGEVDNLASRIGHPFSVQDLMVATEGNISEIRVVAKGYTYVLRRGGKRWPEGVAEGFERTLKEYKNSYVEATRKLNVRIGTDDAHKEVQKSRIRLTALNKALKKTADDYGLYYAYRKNAR